MTGGGPFGGGGDADARGTTTAGGDGVCWSRGCCPCGGGGGAVRVSIHDDDDETTAGGSCLFISDDSWRRFHLHLDCFTSLGFLGQALPRRRRQGLLDKAHGGCHSGRGRLCPEESAHAEVCFWQPIWMFRVVNREHTPTLHTCRRRHIAAMPVYEHSTFTTILRRRPPSATRTYFISF
jgi:hypothetical protein